MLKGICAFEAWSRGAGDVRDKPVSGSRVLFDAVEEAPDEDGKTSDSLEGGSFFSVFHIPVAQGNEPGPACPRPRAAEEVPWEPHGPAPPASAEGVVG